MIALGILFIPLIILFVIAMIYMFLGTTPILINELGALDQAPEWMNSSNFFAWVLMYLVCLIVFLIIRYIITLIIALTAWLAVILLWLINPKQKPDLMGFSYGEINVSLKNYKGTLTVITIVSLGYIVVGILTSNFLTPIIVDWFVERDTYNDFNNNWVMTAAIWYMILSLFISNNQENNKSAD